MAYRNGAAIMAAYQAKKRIANVARHGINNENGIIKMAAAWREKAIMAKAAWRGKIMRKIMAWQQAWRNESGIANGVIGMARSISGIWRAWHQACVKAVAA